MGRISKRQFKFTGTYHGGRIRHWVQWILAGQTDVAATEICVLGINDLIQQEGFMSFLCFYHDLRHKNKISLRLILNPTETNYREVEESRKTGMFKGRDKVKLVETTFPLGIFIFKDHVINIISGDQVTAFDMKSKQASERFRNFFNSIWQ